MSSGTKRVAIIGAGASGLPAIKCCLDEGVIPVCFERTDIIGGLWHFTDNPIEGQGCVMKSTVINTSKEMMSYSDFPIPERFPIFMHNTQVVEYFKLYADEFKLREHIRFHTEVLRVKKAEDFLDTGRWEIHSRHRQTQEEKTEVFDGVLVCSGHHADKYDPELPGLKDFKGQVVHSHDYRNPETMSGKRVLIIGMGNSGGDIAVEQSRIASQVFVSTRRGTWMWNRVFDNGYPLDMVMANRVKMGMRRLMGAKLANWFSIRKLNQRFDHDLYSLTPDYMPFQQHPMVNDDMPNRIVCGAIKIKSDIKRFTETGVEFIDGTKEEDIDVIIKATGYSFGFPFVDKEIIDVKENRVELYKYVFPPDLEHSTLAVIGCFQPLGAIMPVGELQCRLAVSVIKGDVTLPSFADKWADIRNKEAAMARRYVKSRRHTIQIDYIPFSDELAQLAGCMPNYWEIFKSDPYLGFKMIFGPVTPYHYRMTGPNTWPGAREAILTQWDRTRYPLKTRQLPVMEKSDTLKWKVACIAIVVFLILRFFFF